MADETKGALKSSTIRNALYGFASYLATLYASNQTEIAELLQNLLPAWAAPIAPGVVEAIGLLFAAYFTGKVVQGRVAADSKIKGLF